MMNGLVDDEEQEILDSEHAGPPTLSMFSILLQDVEGFRSSFRLSFSFFFSICLSIYLSLPFFSFCFTSFRSGSQEWKVLRDVCLLCFRSCHLGRRPSPAVYPSKSAPTNLTAWSCTAVVELTRGYVNFVWYIVSFFSSFSRRTARGKYS